MSTANRDPDRFDVVVCGSGMAGLCAAVSAAEAGAHVLVVEKGPRPGGTTLLSSGTIWTWRDFAELEAAIPEGNPILQRIVFDTIDDGRAWLLQHGVRLEPEAIVQDHGRGRKMEPTQAIPALIEVLVAAGGLLRLGAALDELTVKDGRVNGLVVASSDRTVTLAAGAVVLATGEFQGNPELVSRYIVTPPENLYLRANPWSTGDALIAATKVGAEITSGLETFYGHALIAPPAAFDEEHFGEVSQYYGRRSVAINMDGLRFVDESQGTGEEVLNQSLARQPGGRGWYIINSSIAAMPYVGDRIISVIVERAQRYGATMVTADSIEALAEALGKHGVSPANVVRTLRDFNEAVESKTTVNLVPPRTGNQFGLTTPPFVAVSVKASVTLTMGGLAVDDSMRVLRRSASSSSMAQSIMHLDEYRTTPIPGLFAAGGDVGNLSHAGYMGMLGAAVATGRIAGVESARAGLAARVSDPHQSQAAAQASGGQVR